MSETTIWIVIILLGLGTFALRLSFVQFAGGLHMPERILRLLRFVPAAVLSALIAPAILRGSQGTFDFAWSNAHLPAALVAALLAWRTRNMLVALAGGMIVLWLWQAFM